MRGPAQGLIPTCESILEKQFSMKPLGPRLLEKRRWSIWQSAMGRRKVCQHSGFLSVYATASCFVSSIEGGGKPPAFAQVAAQKLDCKHRLSPIRELESWSHEFAPKKEGRGGSGSGGKGIPNNIFLIRASLSLLFDMFLSSLVYFLSRWL